MPIEDKPGNGPDLGAVLLLLHSEDNRLALQRLLNLAVDMKLPATFEALLAELERVNVIRLR
jgi:hypothetical protein